jgi:hypothetical protein
LLGGDHMTISFLSWHLVRLSIFRFIHHHYLEINPALALHIT